MIVTAGRGNEFTGLRGEHGTNGFPLSFKFLEAMVGSGKSSREEGKSVFEYLVHYVVSD